MAKPIRLDKFLADMNKGSRSQIREAGKKGRIQINGQTEKKTDRKIDPDRDEVTFDGEKILYHAYEYYMLYKPQGVISATEDGRHKTVIDLLSGENRRDLFPVGRLDIDTEGLLLLTNDGDLTHRLLAPGKHVDKQYYAKISGVLPADAKEQMAGGMTLEDGTEVKPGRLEILHLAQDSSSLSEVLLTIQEGKFHQVKRMFEVLGCRVEYLKRLSMGSLKLDETLAPGEYRRLTAEEVSALQQHGIATTEHEVTTNADRTMKNANTTTTSATRANAPMADTIIANPTMENSETNLNGQRVMEKVNTKKAILFDLDGTLVDSMWMWHQIDIEYLSSFGLECPPDLEKTIEGMSFSETAVYFKERFQLPKSLDEIKQAWVEMSLEKYRSQVPLKKGARRFLEYLKGHGILAGIATSNGQAMVEAVLESLEIRPYFQVVATACEVANGKPAPDIYLEVARRLGVEPVSCMVFEDVPAGIQAGKSAGMEVCAVEDDFSAKMRAEKEQLADYFIEDYEELFR